MMINASLIVDPRAQTRILDFRKDLTAGDIQSVGAGKFVIGEYSPPKNSVLIIKAIVPYAQARIEIGSATEDFEMIDPIKGNGHFHFNHCI